MYMESLLLQSGTKNIIDKILKLKPKYNNLKYILESAYKQEKIIKNLKNQNYNKYFYLS